MPISGLIHTLPPPPAGRTGWPWTEETLPDVYSSRDSWPKISIVTPSFNQGAYIEETIRSVLLQNYPNLEYVVIDGGSTDQTKEILEKYKPWMDHLVIESDRGQSHALNKGISKCTGELFNWINSDDYYTPGSLATIAEAFIIQCNLEVLCGAQYVFNENGKGQVLPGTTLSGPLEQLVYEGHIDQPCTFFRMTIFRQLLPLDEALQYCMDADLWLNYLLLRSAAHVKSIPEVIVNFRIHNNSKTGSIYSKFEEEKNYLRLKVMLSYHSEAPTIDYFKKVSPLRNDLLAREIKFYSAKLIEFDIRLFMKYVKTKLTFSAYQEGDYAQAKRFTKGAWFFLLSNRSYSALKLRLLLPEKLIRWMRNRKNNIE